MSIFQKSLKYFINIFNHSKYIMQEFKAKKYVCVWGYMLKKIGVGN